MQRLTTRRAPAAARLTARARAGFSLAAGALYGTPARVAEQVAELRDAGVHHVLAQMSFGYLGHERITASMRRFGLEVMPAFR